MKTREKGVVEEIQEERVTQTVFWRRVQHSLLHHLPFIGYIIFYMVLLVVVAYSLGVKEVISFNLYNPLPLGTLIFVVAYLLARFLYLALFVRSGNLGQQIREELLHAVRERLFLALPIMLFLPIFLSTFTSFKVLIPVINPYSWDPALARLDAAIHGGEQLWVLLHSFFSAPLATYYINVLYNAWFFTMFVVINWQAFSLSNPKLRMQFFMTFIMTWSLLGTGLGTTFASVGPCYYDKMFGDNLFLPLMDSLRSVTRYYPVWALETQEMLWAAFRQDQVVLGSGISAMPSMHVSAALLFALVGLRSNWVYGSLLTAFFVAIMIGSVHLGWHYAVDGYLSIVGTLILWLVAGMLVKRFPQVETTSLP